MGDTRTLDLVVNAQTEAARAELTKLGATTGDTFAKVDENLTKIEASINKLGNAGSVVSGVVGGLIAGFAEGIGETARSFVEASERALEYAGTLQKVADKAGTTTDFLQKYRYAAQQNDVETTKADEGLQQFNRSVGLAAEGNLKASTAFAALHVEIHNTADGSLKSLPENFIAVAEGISKIASPSEQAARAQALFKESGVDLLPLLRQGAQAFDDYSAAAKRLGLILTPEQIANAAEAEQKFKDIKNQLSVEFASAITANADALLHLAEAMKSVAEAAGHGLQNTRDFYSAIGHGAQSVYTKAGGGAAGAYAVATTDVTDLYTAGLLADPKRQQQNDFNDLNALPRGSAIYNEQAAAYHKKYPKVAAKPVNTTLPVDDRAQGVLEKLTTKASANGDPRQLAIDAELSAAGVTADSAIGKKIAAAAGTVYDNGPGARAAETAANKAAAEARRAAAEKQRIANQEAAANRDVVGVRRAYNAAEASAADTPEARYALATSNIQDNLSDKLGVINDKQKTGKLSALQAQEEATLEKQIAVDQQIVVDRNEQARKVAEQLQLVETDLGVQRDQLTARLAIADTASQRRDIELRLLELQQQEEKAIQQAIIDSKKSTPAEISAARKQLANIDATAGDKREAVLRGTEDPLQSYTRSMNLDAGRLNESLKQVQVDGLKGLDDGLTGLIDGTENVGTAFKKMATSIIADLARILVEKAIVGPLANVLGGGSASAAGGIIGAIFGGGFASGGVPPSGKVSLVGENGPEWIVGNGTARVVPMPPASPRSATTGASGGGGTNITVDARGATDPAEVDRRVRAGIIAAAPALHAGIRDSTIAAIKRPGLPGGRS